MAREPLSPAHDGGACSARPHEDGSASHSGDEHDERRKGGELHRAGMAEGREAWRGAHVQGGTDASRVSFELAQSVSIPST